MNQIKLRQLIKKGDPKLNVLIPKQLKMLIKLAAKGARRSPQDEVIKRLAASFKHEENYQRLQTTLSKKMANPL